jgi:hypothetical protein
MTTIDIEPFEESEEDRIRSWREEVLERAGYGVSAASELARNSRVDLHEAVELIRRGCPAELAVEILL